MQNSRHSTTAARGGLARHMPLTSSWSNGPEGALIQDEQADEDRIAVVYDSGETPPEITITETAGSIQTICANGVAVAIIACADGPRLTVDDILLVERYVSGR